MKKKAIIIDLDGTLVNNSARDKGIDGSQHADWDKFNLLSENEPPNQWCVDIIEKFSNDHKIIFLTARSGSDVVKEMTMQWLVNNLSIETMSNSLLLMRNKDDRRVDVLFKEEFYHKFIEKEYDVVFAVDDKKAIADLWRKLRVPALHCQDY